MPGPGERVAVIGLGASNRAVVPFLLRRGALVDLYDRKPLEGLDPACREWAGTAAFHLGPGYLDALAEARPDWLCLTPGMRKDLPQLEAARRLGARVTSETALFFALCPIPICGITGSAGKTTTTTLTGLLLDAVVRPAARVWVGGNIGRPLLPEVDRFGPGDRVVVELSSFQLELLEQSPRWAGYLNLRPNHLDIHASMEEYAAAKERIYRFQGADGVLVYNADDPALSGVPHRAPGRAVPFSIAGWAPGGAYLSEGSLWWGGGGGRPERVLERADLALPGEHNVQNALAAIALAAVQGVPPAAMGGPLASFRGVEHRLEPVAEIGGVRYVNDSIATSPDRTCAALRTYAGEPVILLAGGYDKGIPFDELADELVAEGSPVGHLILFGATAGAIEGAVREAAERAGRPGPALQRAEGLEEALERARAVARPGSVVLLSPACASYDQFRDFAERGRRFKELVRERAGRGG